MTPKLLAPILALAVGVWAALVSVAWPATAVQQQAATGLTLDTAQVIAIVGGLLGGPTLAVVALFRAWQGSQTAAAAAERLNAQNQLAAKDGQIAALTAQIAAQTEAAKQKDAEQVAATKEKDTQIAEHATQVIGLLQGVVAGSTNASTAQTAMLGSLRETALGGVQAASKEHAAILDALQQMVAEIEFRREQDRGWKPGMPERRKAAR